MSKEAQARRLQINALDSPIDSIREIQQDRAVNDLPPAAVEGMVIQFVRKPDGKMDVESALGPVETLKALGAAYMAIWRQINPGKQPPMLGQEKATESRIIVPR